MIWSRKHERNSVTRVRDELAESEIGRYRMPDTQLAVPKLEGSGSRSSCPRDWKHKNEITINVTCVWINKLSVYIFYKYKIQNLTILFSGKERDNNWDSMTVFGTFGRNFSDGPGRDKKGHLVIGPHFTYPFRLQYLFAFYYPVIGPH